MASDKTGENDTTSSSPGTDIEQTKIGQHDAGNSQPGWDGPDDPDNPLNWPNSKRYLHVIVIAVLVLIVNLAATMFAPAASQLMSDFDFSSETIASLTVSLYVLGFALGPLIWAPLSELYGRLVVYGVSTIIFLAFIIASAFAKNLASFMVFRLLSGCAGGSSLAVSGGTLADVILPEQRGRWMALFVIGPILGPVLGPIMGGFTGERAGWRWVFRAIAIASGAILVLGAMFVRETYGPIILRRKEERRRKSNPDNHRPVKKPDVWGELAGTILRPMQLLIFSPIVFLLSLYAAFCFGLLFLLFTTFAAVFMGQYGWSIGNSGLAYIGMGVGLLGGTVVQAIVGDGLMKKQAAKTGRSIPEHRLLLMAVMAPTIPVGIFWYGWTAYKQTHWIVPIIGTVFIGIGFIFTMMPCMVYLIDCFGSGSAASALAAQTLLRSIAGAFLPLAGPALYNSLGLGWGNSLLGFLAVAMQPIPWLFFLYGEKIRLRSKINL